MRIAVGSDERTPMTDVVLADLEARGHETVRFGPLAGERKQWAEVAEDVARRVASRDCHQGVLFCWTGTGVTMAANKVPGIRAALCGDAETARGARRWNDANILAISLRATTDVVAKEMLDAWFSAEPDESEKPSWEVLERLDRARE